MSVDISHSTIKFYSFDIVTCSKNQNGATTTSDNVDSESDSAVSQANESAESIHLLSLELSQLHLVDTRTKFYAMLRTLIRENMVAFDAEWKPTFFSTNEVALIQLVIGKQKNFRRIGRPLKSKTVFLYCNARRPESKYFWSMLCS